MKTINRLWPTATLAVGFITAGNVNAVEFEFIGQAAFQPTFFENFDFDSDSPDSPTGTSAGTVDVGGLFTRAEIRLGAIAKGDNWSAKLLLENDVDIDQTAADRGGRGTNFGIERAYYTYDLTPTATFQAGWEFKQLDINSGNLLYADDHPIFGFMGDTSWGGYDVYWIPVTNTPNEPAVSTAAEGDWNVLAGKWDIELGSGQRFTPILAYSDNNEADEENSRAKVTYFGGEFIGQLSGVNVSAEVLGATGEFDSGRLSGDDISAAAAFGGLELPISETFNPYVAVRWHSGDDDPTDNDVEGWNGISDLARFAPLIGMDGQIMGFGMNGTPAFSTPIFGLSLENSGPGGAGYGGIGNGGSGNNPGQLLLALGSSGNLASISPKLSYKGQVFFIWYDETGALEALPNARSNVDDYAATVFDVQFKYQYNQHFSTRFVGSTVIPGDGIEDATGGAGTDNAYSGMIEFAWNY